MFLFGEFKLFIKKILFAYLFVAFSTAFCMEKIVNVAVFIEKDAKGKKIAIPYEENKEIFVSQEEELAIKYEEYHLAGTITRTLLAAIKQNIDIIFISPALMRSLYYSNKENYLLFEQNFDLYKTKPARFAILIQKKLDPLLANKCLDFDYLELVESCDIVNIYENFKQRDYNNKNFIDTLISVFTKDFSIKKIVYLGGHGSYNDTIANLTISEYIKLIDTLNKIGCLLLHVNSCNSGGRNSTHAHSKLEKVNFPIFHLAFTDQFARHIKEINFDGFYKNLQTFFKKNNVNGESFLYNSLIKKAFKYINGLEFKTLDKTKDFKLTNLKTAGACILVGATVGKTVGCIVMGSVGGAVV